MERDAIYLVTKADDIGSNDSANRAFAEGFERGILRNGVIMVTCEKAAEAAQRFRGEPDFCMGLHLTMNAEWDRVKWGPVAPREQVPSIVDAAGWLYQTTQALHDAKPAVEDVLREMDAQLALAREYGLDIFFADAHMLFTWAVGVWGRRCAIGARGMAWYMAWATCPACPGRLPAIRRPSG